MKKPTDIFFRNSENHKTAYQVTNLEGSSQARNKSNKTSELKKVFRVHVADRHRGNLH